MHRVWETSALFTLNNPPHIIFGPGTIKRVGERAREYGATRAVVIADANVVRAGYVERVVTSLTDAGVESEVFGRVEHEPSTDLVRDGVAFCEGKRFDLLVAVGGGSALDLAKAINVVLTNGGDPNDYIFDNRAITEPLLPHIAVATTAGTAADVSGGAVISVPERSTKENFPRPPWRTITAICDPELTLTCPPRVTAHSGMDALGHAIDSYTNVNFNPLSDAIDLQVMRLLAEYLPVAVAKGSNLTDRSAVMFAASSAGFGFSQRGTALTHGISHPLGVYGNLPHGLTISLLLPYVMEYNLDACASKLADVAEAMGQSVAGLSTREAALKAVDAVRTLTRSIDMPQRLRDAGVREDVLPAIARDTVTQRRANVAINPRDATEEQVLDLLRRAF
jgi:alcohol dehydrogenase class IV